MATAPDITDHLCAPRFGREPSLLAVAAVLVGLGVLISATVWAQIAADTTAARLALDIGVGVASWIMSPALLWRPVSATVVMTVLAALSPAATPAATAGALQVSLRRPFSTALAVAVGGVAAHVIQGIWRPADGISLGWRIALVAAAYAAFVGWGALAQSHRRLVRSLRDRADRAEREQEHRVAEARALERTRIAREMHDVLAHRLSLLATYAGALEYRPDAPPQRLAEAAGVVRTQAHRALDDLRDVVTVLREDEDADGTAPQPALSDIPRLVAESRDAGMNVELRMTATDLPAAAATVGRTAYRIVQEGLTNARKHAPGRPVSVSVDDGSEAGLVIEVRNPLTGNEMSVSEQNTAGTGLIGLSERVAFAGGEITHGPSAGEFVLHTWIPWPE